MLIVVALGGNALLERGQPMEASHQRRNVRKTAESLAALAQKHALVICHGNGPQVGLLALQNDAYKKVQPYPLDVLGAESQGMIGYMIQQEISNQLPNKSIVTLLTQVVVNPRDPAFSDPSKPIGPVYNQQEAERLKTEKGFHIANDGAYFRRVVASPEPQEIVELSVIQLLLAQGILPICGGGGGIPVVRHENNRLEGIEAVIDKDNTASLIAEKLNADVLMILTDVNAVSENFGQPNERKIKQISPKALSKMSFPKGSMGPKISASCRFVTRTNKRAIIGNLAEAMNIVGGEAGTTIRQDTVNTEYY